jgi:CheY-like chemotaxis protein
MERQPAVESLLIADHHPDDISLLRQTLQANKLGTAVNAVPDGAEFLKYIHGEGSYADRTRHPIPQIALIEWDLPHKSALEILQNIRDDPHHSMLPVMIWTRAGVTDADLRQAYYLGLSGFFAKPNSPDISAVVRLVFEYWKLAEIPLARKH